MRESYKLKKLKRTRKLRRQRRAFLLALVAAIVMIAHGAFSTPDNISGEYDVISITVQPGDTLWTIAQEYKPQGADLREFVYDLAANNGITDCNILVGQAIFVPIV